MGIRIGSLRVSWKFVGENLWDKETAVELQQQTTQHGMPQLIRNKQSQSPSALKDFGPEGPASPLSGPAFHQVKTLLKKHRSCDRRIPL